MDKDYLLKLARRAIQNYLQNKTLLTLDEENLSPDLKEKRGVFVTLTKDGELRGCIGNLEPIKPLYLAIIENSLAAAFCDPRFAPLSLEEFDKIKIEISILSPLKEITINKKEELLKYLEKKKPGLLLVKDQRSATFLPQVWSELITPQEFLDHLSLKAGLGSKGWQLPGVRFYEYQAQIIEEQN